MFGRVKYIWIGLDMCNAFLLICNDIPDCDDIDNAFSKRLRCLNYPTEFVNEPKKENQKKIDEKLPE